MRPSILTREHLQIILRTVNHHPQGYTVRDFDRRKHIRPWELEQAAELGWIVIETRKPRTGRPSRVVKLKTNVNNSHAAKLPPWRSDIEPEISIRHWLFAIETQAIGPRRNYFGWGIQSKVTAYRKVYKRAKYSSARAGACRLMKHLDVRACRRWFHAQTNGIVSVSESMPTTRRALLCRLLELSPR